MFDFGWPRLPQGEAAELNADLAGASPAFFHLPGNFAELVNGDLLTTNIPTLAAGEEGPAFTLAGAGASIGRSTRLTTSDGAGTGDFTLVVYAAPQSSGTRQMPYAQVAGSQETYLVFNSSNSIFSASAGGWGFVGFGGNPGVASATGVDGRAHVFVVRRRAGTIDILRDGVVAGSVAYGTTISGAGAFDYIGGYASSGFGHTDPLYYVAGFNSALSDAALAAWTDPLWCFKPRTMLVPGPAAVGSGTTVGGTVGSATGTGRTATVALHTTVAGTVGTATATGRTATTAAHVTVAATVGSATGTGRTATLALHTTVAATVGVATATGRTASLAAPTTVSAQVGTATGTGLTATIAAHTRVAASIGSASATGLQASVGATTRILGTVGTATGTGRTATLVLAGRINATVGTATAIGLHASTSITDRISASTGSATAAGQLATVGLHTVISASVGSATAAGAAARVIASTRLATSVGTATGTGAPAAIVPHTRIAATVGAATANGASAEVIVGTGGGSGASLRQILEGIFGRVVEGGITFEQLLRIQMAALTGTTSGIGTTTERYNSLDGAKPRVTATFDEQGNRAAVELDGSI